jgi:hypothetical protein
MAVVRGKDFKLYRNSDSPYDNSPTWVLVDNVKDLTRTVEKALADASVRGSSFRQQVGTMKDLSLEFQMVYDPTDAALTAFEGAFYSDANVEMLVLDGLIATAGSKGLRFMAQVTNFSVNEALEDVGLVDVTLVPGYDSANLPRRVSVVTPGSVTDT